MFINFADATGGLISDAASWHSADEATRARALAAWQAHDARFAASFADRSIQDWMDAQVGRAFLTPQLYRIETEVYQRKYPSYDFASLMTVVTDGDMWDLGTVFYSMENAGAAQFLSGKGFDMPYAGNLWGQHTHAYHLAGIGYEWTVQELERAAKLGRALTSDKAMAADQAAQAFLWSIAMTGKAPGASVSEKGWTGLVNNSSAPAAQVAADGAGSSRLWSAKDADKILRDINEAIEAVTTGTVETHAANTLLLPTSRYQLLARTRLGDTTDTILKFVRENNSYTALTGLPLTIRATRALETAGTGSSARLIAYENSREVVRFHLPGQHTFLPPFQKSSMTYEVGGIMNVGGTEVRLPKAIVYRDSF